MLPQHGKVNGATCRNSTSRSRIGRTVPEERGTSAAYNLALLRRDAPSGRLLGQLSLGRASVVPPRAAERTSVAAVIEQRCGDAGGVALATSRAVGAERRPGAQCIGDGARLGPEHHDRLHRPTADAHEPCPSPQAMGWALGHNRRPHVTSLARVRPDQPADHEGRPRPRRAELTG